MFRDSSPLGKVTRWLARWTAVAGGVVLIAMVVVIIVSVVGRAMIWAGLRPIAGDYELVGVGMGFAVFAFLPWAHLERGHALVSIVTDRFPQVVNSWILVATDLMMFVAAAFIAWRLYAGMMDKFAYKETTLLLRMPLGWGYAAGFFGAAVMVIVAAYVLGRSLTNAITGTPEVRQAGGEV